MNVFNRIIVILLLLILLALAVLMAILPLETLRAAQSGLTAAATWLEQLSSRTAWLFVVGRISLVLAALILFVLFFWAEIRPRRPRAVRVATEGGSQAVVTTDSVAQRLQWHIDQLADVISVTPEVSARGRSVNVRLQLETRPEIDVPMKTEEVIGVAREVITERMGLHLGRIEVHIKHAPYQEGSVL
jgi:hypothetical protein